MTHIMRYFLNQILRCECRHSLIKKTHKKLRWNMKNCNHMKKWKKLNNKWNQLLILIILYCSESLMFREMFSASIRVGIIIAFGVVYFIFNGRKVHLHFSKNMAMAFIALLFCVLMSVIINGFDSTFDLWVILILIVSIVICSSINYADFWTAYVDVMVGLSLVSIVIFVSYQFVPGLFSIFPNYFWHSGILIKNCFVCVVQVNSQYRRNFGIFFEPGMYSVLLVIALYFSLFRIDLNIKRIGILLIALATTFSTNGYFCSVGLIVAFLLNKKSFSQKIRNRVITLIVVTLLGVVMFFLINPSNKDFLLNKLTEIKFDASVNSDGSGSGYERWRSVVYACNAFLSNPVLGVGYVGWLRIFNSVIATATPINWFGLYGMVYGILMNFFYLKNTIIYTRRNNVNYISTIIMVIVFIANIMSQNMSADLTILILIFYQIKRNSQLQIEKRR